MSDTGWKSPGTVVNDSSFGTDVWSNPENAMSANGSYASVSGMSSTYRYTQLLKGTNFGFSIPAGSTINGIAIQVKRYNEYQYTYDEGVYIVKADGSIGTSNKALATAWGQTNVYFDYGGSTDLWGETWMASNINDTDFGVALYVKYNDSSGGSIGNGVFIDHIQIKVYYTEPTPTIGTKYPLPAFRR